MWSHSDQLRRRCGINPMFDFLLISVSPDASLFISDELGLPVQSKICLTDCPVRSLPSASVIVSRLLRWPRFPGSMQSSDQDSDFFVVAHETPRPTTRKKRPGACTRCRNRKVKCDGQFPVCGNCMKAGTECDANTASAPRSVLTECI